MDIINEAHRNDHLARPNLLLRAAMMASKHYRKARDLPGALRGQISDLETLDQALLLEHLAKRELRWEELRRAKAAAYRPAQHLWVLTAYLAEAGIPIIDQEASNEGIGL